MLGFLAFLFDAFEIFDRIDIDYQYFIIILWIELQPYFVLYGGDISRSNFQIVVVSHDNRIVNHLTR